MINLLDVIAGIMDWPYYTWDETGDSDIRAVRVTGIFIGMFLYYPILLVSLVCAAILILPAIIQDVW